MITLKGQFPSSPLVAPSDRRALNEFVKAAPTAYGPNGAAARKSLENISKASGGIKKGTQMYRALSGHDLEQLRGLKPGESFTLDAPRSFAGAQDLQDIGKFAKEGGTGATPTNAVANIEAMHPLSGVSRVNEFLHASKPGQVEGLPSEGLINHGTRLTLHSYTPGKDGAPDSYSLGAYNPELDEK
jgi:hypothetical protein